MVGYGTKVTFLDEFRMVVLRSDRGGGLAELVLFNTLLPQDHPRNLRRFHIPLRYRNRFSIVTDRDGSFGAQDQSFVIDPAQAILVVGVSDSDKPHHVLLVMRTQALITRACSMSSDASIPWDEWGRNVMIMEMVRDDINVFVQGVHVIVVKRRTPVGDDTGYLCLRTFDFSLRGCSALWDKGDRAGRTDLYEGGRDFILKGTRGVSDWGLNPLGSGTFYSLVSCTWRWKTYAYGVLIPS